jgi:hypothetical protein
MAWVFEAQRGRRARYGSETYMASDPSRGFE